MFQGPIREMKNLIVPGSLKQLQSSPRSIYYILYSNFFYTQLASAVVSQKDLYYVCCNTDAFTFCILFLQKKCDTFPVLLSGAFLCSFDNIYLSFLHIEKNL